MSTDQKAQGAIGKDEVGSSNLPSSSKPLESLGFPRVARCLDMGGLGGVGGRGGEVGRG